VRAFLHRLANTLDAGDSLGEMIFALIMVIGVTSSPRYQFVESPEAFEILASAFLLAVAWAIIDSGLSILGSVFEQGRARSAARAIGAAVPAVRVGESEWMTALATLSAVLIVALPPLVPFLLPVPLVVATIASNVLAVATLAWVGWFWARWTDFPRWACALVVAVIGVAAVQLTLLLGVA